MSAISVYRRYIIWYVRLYLNLKISDLSIHPRLNPHAIVFPAAIAYLLYAPCACKRNLLLSLLVLIKYTEIQSIHKHRPAGYHWSKTVNSLRKWRRQSHIHSVREKVSPLPLKRKITAVVFSIVFTYFELSAAGLLISSRLSIRLWT